MRHLPHCAPFLTGIPDSAVRKFRLSLKHSPYYADSIVNAVLPRGPAVTDRHLWIEVAEYLVVVVGVIALAWLIADELGSPLWGGLTSIRLR